MGGLPEQGGKDQTTAAFIVACQAKLDSLETNRPSLESAHATLDVYRQVFEYCDPTPEDQFDLEVEFYAYSTYIARAKTRNLLLGKTN